MNQKRYFQYFVLLSVFIVIMLSAALLNIYTPAGRFWGAYVCNDTDSGVDYYERGTAWGTQGIQTDYCMANSTLYEYYCIDLMGQSFMQGHRFECSAACKDGRC